MSNTIFYKPRSVPRPKLKQMDLAETDILHDSQAAKVIKKFGGVYPLARTLSYFGRPKNPTTIYRWLYPKSKGGTGGWIPTAAWADILFVARLEGIVLDPSDMDPRFRK